MTSSGLIPRRRLQLIPHDLHLSHEYCYFIHDECARLLVEYEEVGAHFVNLDFSDKSKAKLFKKLAKDGPIDAMRFLGYNDEAKKVILNNIKMAMVADSLHHIYEAMQCLEKRKFVVAFNLLRKPLMDSLTYLSWMLADEEAFYKAFSSGNPDLLTNKKTGNIRRDVLSAALDKTSVKKILPVELIHDLIFSPGERHGFFQLFQHAVHLITVGKVQIQTEPENFNFIFKNPFEDDIYEETYLTLPVILLYLSHVIIELFDQIKPMENGGKQAFISRSILGFNLIGTDGDIKEVQDTLAKTLSANIECEKCTKKFVATRYNSARAILRESFRCSQCRHINYLPFSYIFD